MMKNDDDPGFNDVCVCMHPTRTSANSGAIVSKRFGEITTEESLKAHDHMITKTLRMICSVLGDDVTYMSK